MFLHPKIPLLQGGILLCKKSIKHLVQLSEATKKQRTKQKKWPGQILQVSGQLASSISTQYDDESAVIGSNLDYAAIHQLGGQAGKNKKVEIPARPYLKLTDDDLNEILDATKNFLK